MNDNMTWTELFDELHRVTGRYWWRDSVFSNTFQIRTNFHSDGQDFSVIIRFGDGRIHAHAEPSNAIHHRGWDIEAGGIGWRNYQHPRSERLSNPHYRTAQTLNDLLEQAQLAAVQLVDERRQTINDAVAGRQRETARS